MYYMYIYICMICLISKKDLVKEKEESGDRCESVPGCLKQHSKIPPLNPTILPKTMVKIKI